MSRTRGHTLVEMAFAAVIFAGIFGSLAVYVRRGMRLYSSSSANAQINSRAGKAILRITDEMMGARGGSFFPVLDVAGPPTFWSDSLEFRVAVDWAAGAPVWGARKRIALELAPDELDNGIDDNGDGLVDESDLVLTLNVGDPDEQRLVIGRGVTELLEGEVLDGGDTNGNGLEDERGLCFALENGVLVIRMSVALFGPEGELQLRTYSSSIRLRNI